MEQNKKMVVLFQGDSITDAWRSRENGIEHNRGSGYPTMVSAVLGLREPNTYICLNRGNSGDRVVDLYARWKRDCLNLKPDVLSILIGVNDVWHEFDYHNGVEAEKFELVYNLLLEETRRKLPGIRLMILEPFALKASDTEEQWEEFSREVHLRAEAARRVAEANGAVFVPLQKVLDDACADGTPASEWLRDGVHPTAAGHALITREWLKAFDSMK